MYGTRLVLMVLVAAAAIGGVVLLGYDVAAAREVRTANGQAAALRLDLQDVSRKRSELALELQAQSDREQKRAALDADLGRKRAELVTLQDENARLQQEAQARRKAAAAPSSESGAVAPAPITRGAGAVTLSFDDYGSPARVNAILDVLATNGVKAVFCLTGDWAADHPDLVARMRSEGHLLCNHTASHVWLTRLPDEAVRQEIAGGVQSTLLRPPYGDYNATVASIAASLGYQIYLWSIDTRDWSGVSADSIVNTVVGNLRPGAVVLMHLHGTSTLDALPRLIAAVRAAGYDLGY